MRRNFTILLLAMAFVAWTGCRGTKPSGEITQSQELREVLADSLLDSVVITLFRPRVRVPWPTYSVKVLGDGRVEYNGHEFVKVKGFQSAQIPRDSVKALVVEFMQVNFMTAPLKVSELTVLGATMASVSMEIGGRSREITRPYRWTPSSSEHFDQAHVWVSALSDRIDQIAVTERWTGLAERMRRVDSLMDARTSNPEK